MSELKEHVKYYENGKLKEKCFYNKNNKREGEWIQYYKNGNVKKNFSCKNGYFHGERNYFYKNGLPQYKKFYQHNVIKGEKEYYKNGNLKYECFYTKSRKLEGLCTEYYENGQLKCKSFWQYGIKSGLETEYYENGQIKCESFCVSGAPVQQIEYYPDGQIKACFYSDGIRQIFGVKYKNSTPINSFYVPYCYEDDIKDSLNILALLCCKTNKKFWDVLEQLD